MALRQGLSGLPRLFSGLRGFHSSGAVADGALQETTAQAGKFMSWLKGDKSFSRISVPLTQPLPGVVAEKGYPASLQPPPTEITVLSNGLRIISEASPGPTASLGLYVNSGSIYETQQTSGCSALLECLAFKSSVHRTTTGIMQEVEKVGSNIIANASREQMTYTIDCLKTSLPAALELLCDTVLNPKFDPLEVDEQKQRLLMLLSNKDIHATLLNELLTRNSYKGAYGNPLIPEVQQLHNLSPAVLHQFVSEHYTAPNMVLAAAGVDHAELVSLAEPMVAALPAAKAMVEPSSQYVGGHVHLPGSFPQANVLLAFEYQGGWRNVQGAVVMTVLNYLLGGGNSFSSGGPGKGMHSRLYTRVLNQYGWVQSCSAFNSTFNSSGLMGIQASCDPQYVQDMINVMCTQLEGVGRSTNRIELDRAKRAAVSVICNALESKATSAEDIGRQFLTYGRRISGREYVDMIEAVTQQDVANFMDQLLASKASLALHGDNTHTVNYDALAKRYR